MLETDAERVTWWEIWFRTRANGLIGVMKSARDLMIRDAAQELALIELIHRERITALEAALEAGEGEDASGK